MSEVSELIQRIMDLTGWNQGQLAKQIGVSQGQVAKYKNGENSPNKEKWDRMMHLIRSDDRLASLAAVTESSEIPVMGRVGAGEVVSPDFEQVPPDGISQVTVPFSVPPGLFIAFEVTGDSMATRYDEGDVLVVYRDQRHPVINYQGKVVVVRTEDGKRYVKRLYAGSRDGLFLLHSEANRPPILDVSVTWVGEIVATVSAGQIEEARPEPRTPKTGKRPRRVAF